MAEDCGDCESELDPKDRMGTAALLELLKGDDAGNGAGCECAGRAD